MGKIKKRNNVDRAGIGALTLLFSNTEWAFREDPITDIGIDAQLEIIENNKSTGQLIALQVKSGLSFFKNENENSYIYYVDSNHIDYWFKHNLPVILILYHPKEKKLYWAPISMETVTHNKVGYKVEIRKDAILDENTYILMKKSFFLHNRVLYRFNKLKNQLHLIQKVANGDEITIEFCDYINKTLSRTDITISYYENNTEIKEKIQTTFCEGLSSLGIVQSIFPWASLEMDFDSYKEEKRQQDLYENGIRDSETGEYYPQGGFDEYYQEPEDIVPYSNDGEINLYKVTLKLNEIGKGFLDIYNFLSNPSYVEIDSFTIDDVMSDQTNEA